jgi:L-asparagine oxygenase
MISLHHPSAISVAETNSFLFRKAAKAVNPDPENPIPFLLEKAKELGGYLKPVEKDVRKVTQGDTAWAVIDNLPIDEELPPTPLNDQRPTDKGYVSELTLLSMLHRAELQPLAFQQEKNGQLIQEIAPMRGFSQTQSNAGRVPFAYHADNGHLPREFRPEYLLLLGLRNPGETKTWIADVADVMQKLRREYSECDRILRQPRYRMQSPNSFDYNGNSIVTKPQAFITTNQQGYDEVTGNLSNIQALDEKAKTALETFTSFLKPPIAKSVVIKPGTLLMFNNLRCLHSRDAVLSDRWLQRIYARTSLDALRAATGSDGFVFDSRLIALS